LERGITVKSLTTAMSFAVRAVFVTVVLTMATIARAADDGTTALTVDASVQRAVASIGSSQPKFPLKRAKFSMEFPSRPNAQLSELESRYEPLGDGLWGVMSTLKRSNGAGAQQVVTMCGMFDALAATSANASIDQTMAIPIGKVFVPMGMKTNFVTDSVTRMSNITVDAKALCAPAAGSSFDYATQTETQYKVSPGFGGSPKTISVTIKGRCEASQKMPATALHSSLRGDYLAVMCSGTNDSGKLLARKFAYLLDSTIYILLETKSETSQFKYTVLDVEYEN
jgi:hypothetical protein